MSALALVPYPIGTSPSQRYRLEQWLPSLLEQSISMDVQSFADAHLMALLHKPGHALAKLALGSIAVVRRWRQILAAPGYDVVVLHRTACLAGPALLERLIPLLRRPLVFDFDDAIYMLHSSDANRAVGFLKFPGKTASICRLSTHVVAANRNLAAWAKQHNPRVTVVPSSVDTDSYPLRSERSHGGPTVVGWTGSTTSQTHLEAFAPVLEELAARFPIVVRVHSDREPRLPGIPVEWRPWTASNEVAEISSFDIGIMPMPDDAWSAGKSAMKVLLYLALGVPSIASPVGTNCEVIQHGENGFLAATPDEWLACVGALIRDGELRRRLSRAGRRTVEERYSARSSASLFASVLRSARELQPRDAARHAEPA